MSNKPTYKTTRKYKCPYCDTKAQRGDLVEHVQKKHAELMPEGYTAARAVYDSINGKNYGICMICKKKVYTWNDKINRYNNLCDDPKCRETVRKNALERHMRVYSKPTLLGDPVHQEEMLAKRRISGNYTFSDGGKVGYTGSYEKKALEFMDLVLNIPSKDIQAPGPILEYDYNGTKHYWITDIYYIPANLVIEIKDGGSNPNKKIVGGVRDKQVAKEVMITDKGTFNYIRLTDNNFAQLLSIFADMKNEALNTPEGGNPKVKIHINEAVSFEEINTPQDLYDWMHKNIRYNHTGIFLSPDEVKKNKYGDCHDQAAFEYEILKKLGYKCGRIFMVEYYDWEKAGGATHTVCWYIEDGKYYWFENAWGDQAGINGPYASLKELKDAIADAWEWTGKNYKFFMGNINSSEIKYGMTLEEYCLAVTPEEESKPYAFKDGSITEEVGGLPPQRPPEAYITPIGMNNVFDGFAYTDDQMDSVFISDSNGKSCMRKSDFEKSYGDAIRLYPRNSSQYTVQAIREAMKSNKPDPLVFASIFMNRKLSCFEEVFISDEFRYFDPKREEKINSYIENGVIREAAPDNFDTNIVSSSGNVFICQGVDGYYAVTPKDFYMASEYFPTVEELKSAGVIDLMNDVYRAHFQPQEVETDE